MEKRIGDAARRHERMKAENAFRSQLVDLLMSGAKITVIDNTEEYREATRRSMSKEKP